LSGSVRLAGEVGNRGSAFEAVIIGGNIEVGVNDTCFKNLNTFY